MKIVALNEHSTGDLRGAISPDSVKRLLAVEGVEVAGESGLGGGAHLCDSSLSEAGCEISGDRAALAASADVLFGVAPPDGATVASMKNGAFYAGFCDILRDPAMAERFVNAGVSVLSLERLPRTTRAQPIDALSSQHSLAGYAMVLTAARCFTKIMPMMVTPSGTLAPARVLIIGAGVAGLQAIATAKRLGARVEAFDVRTETKEQVESLGARFVEVDLGETGGEGGYAGELTDAQRESQQKALAARVAAADIVITTAAVPGRSAPRILSADMLGPMRSGSVVVDYGAPTGGNVEGAVAGRTVVTDNGVSIIGVQHPLNDVATDATRMYASNLAALIEHAASVAEDGRVDFARLVESEDPLVRPCTVIHKGRVLVGESS